VRVDDSGIHIAGKGQALPSLDALNKAIAKSGLKIFVADPTKHVKGPAAQLFAGQLVIQLHNDQYTGSANDTGTVLTFGGATIAADTSRGYNYVAQPVPVPSAGQSLPPATSTGGGAPSAGVGSGLPPAQPDVATSPAPAAPPVLAAHRTHLPDGISPVLVVALLLGAGLIAAGLKRLPDEVLATKGTACPLGEQTLLPRPTDSTTRCPAAAARPVGSPGSARPYVSCAPAPAATATSGC
jgi:hypothetical protein